MVNITTESSVNVTDNTDNGIQISSQYMVYIMMCLCILGLLGNILCVLVMIRKGLRHLPFAVYSSTLAVSDSIVLIYHMLENINLLYPMSLHGCIIWRFIMQTCNQYSSWCLVQLTVERFVAVVIPLKCHEIITQTRAVVGLAITFVVLSSVNVHIIWNWEPISCAWTESFRKSAWFFYYIGADILLYSSTPSLLLIVLNVIIIYKLFCTRTNVSAHQKKKQRKIVVLLVGVSLAFLILTTPANVFIVMRYLGYSNAESKSFLAIAYITFILNYGINFYIYSLTGGKVRDEFLKMVHCRKVRDERSSSSHCSPKENQSRV